MQLAVSWLQSLKRLVSPRPRTVRLSHLFLSVESAIGLPAKQAVYDSPPPGKGPVAASAGAPPSALEGRTLALRLVRMNYRIDILIFPRRSHDVNGHHSLAVHSRVITGGTSPRAPRPL